MSTAPIRAYKHSTRTTGRYADIQKTQADWTHEGEVTYARDADEAVSTPVCWTSRSEDTPQETPPAARR